MNSSTLNTGEYRIQVINRPDRRGGGLALITNATLKTKLLDSGQTRAFEYGVWEVKCKNTVTMVTGIYQPLYSVHNPVTTSMFIDDFTYFMRDIQQWRMNNYILGYFNLYISNAEDQDTQIFENTLEAMGLGQHEGFCTH